MLTLTAQQALVESITDELLAVTDAIEAGDEATETVAKCVRLTADLKAADLTLDELRKQHADPPPTPDEQEDETTPPKEEPTMNGPAIIKSDKTRAFSVSKLIQGVSDPTFTGWGYEKEISQETARRSGKDSSAVMLPWGALVMKAAQDSVTNPAAGQDFGQSLARPVNDDALFTITSDALFKPTIGALLGVRQHIAPAGAFFVPRMVDNVTLGWVVRDADVPQTNALFDSVEANPHTLGATVQVNRSALIDCRPLMDQLILEQLQAAAVSALDDALIGAIPPVANAPLGLKGKVTNGGPVTDLETLLALMRTAEMQTGKSPALAIGPLFRDLLDITAASATLTATAASTVLAQRVTPSVSVKLDTVTDSTIFAGDFSGIYQVVFGAGIELAANPYAANVYSKGAVLLRVLCDADTLIQDEKAIQRGTYTPTP